GTTKIINPDASEKIVYLQEEEEQDELVTLYISELRYYDGHTGYSAGGHSNTSVPDVSGIVSVNGFEPVSITQSIITPNNQPHIDE
ncbi:MAG: hypothetical protein LBD99_02050, partial [Candidatus Margulisbacteria bacterium]|nr:hypothetical protein [Candidatus Margulisiibacteriota bacterium]